MAGRRRDGYLEPEEELGITHVRRNVCDRYIHKLATVEPLSLS